MKLILEFASQEELINYAKDLLNVQQTASNPPQVPTAAAPQQAIPQTQPAINIPQAQPIPQVPISNAPQQAQPVSNAPRQIPTSTQSYTLDDISRAAAPLMEAGKQNELSVLVAKYGVQSLQQLDTSLYGAFVMDLRGLGAQI